MNLDFSRCRSVLMPDGSLSDVKEHAKVGVQAIVTHPFFALLDEMGNMKTAQAIISACFMLSEGVIDRVIVVAPASVKSVWYDRDLGELKRHLFLDIPVIVQEQSERKRSWTHGPESINRFPIIVTNYELIRRKSWLNTLLDICTPKTLLILDESTAVKNWKSLQTISCRQLRKKCGRVLLLNGTPISNSPLDMFSQGNLMSPGILECLYISQFMARYAVMGGFHVKTRWGTRIPTQVLRWVNLEDLTKRLAPYVLRRLKVECLDLPEKLAPVTVTVDLTTTTWKYYRDMREELVIWLQSGNVATAQTAAVKIMRLAQITSGFVGGIEEAGIERSDGFLEGLDLDDTEPVAIGSVQEIGREKLDAFLEWLIIRLEEDPNLKLLVQCRFRPEIARLTKELRERYPAMDIGEIVGGQPKQERQDALRLMDPRTTPAGPALVTMSSAGSLGLNLSASHTVVRLSRDYSLWTWLQSEDRVHRPGQISPVSYTDFVARGPKGQKTVDHAVLAALMSKQETASWTSAAWVKALTEE